MDSVPDLRPFCVDFACSPCVCVGSPGVLRLPPKSKNMHVRSMVDTKLSAGVNDCLSNSGNLNFEHVVSHVTRFRSVLNVVQ